MDPRLVSNSLSSQGGLRTFGHLSLQSPGITVLINHAPFILSVLEMEQGLHDTR